MRFFPMTIVSLLVAAGVSACGGGVVDDIPLSDSGADATSHDASSDARIDAADARSDGPSVDGGCVLDPQPGTPCTPGVDVSCPDGVDPCCRGYVVSCDATNSVWNRVGLGCDCSIDAGTDAASPDAAVKDAAADADAATADAGTTCGSKTCTATEYCTTSSGGAQLPDGGTNTFYQCTAVPAACTSTPTCACLKAHGGANGGCQCADVDGRATVTCFLP